MKAAEVLRRALPRSRLVLRVYAMGLLQFAIVVSGIILLSRQPHHVSHTMANAQYVADVLHGAPDPAWEIAHAHSTLGTGFALVADDGELLARAGDVDVPTGGSVESGATPPTRLVLRDGRGAALYAKPDRPPPSPTVPLVLILVVTALVSWVAARSLVTPLTALSSAARRFGQGDLSARASLDRRDELGEVAVAFDEMAERVTHALRAEKELLANVSHELRTPLQRIQIALELAREGDAEIARASLGDIAEDLGELERIVDDVLTAARLSLRKSGTLSPSRAPLRLETMDVGVVVRRAVARFRSAHPDRPLNVSLVDSEVAVVADPVLLRRVVDNLLENAHKCSDDPRSEILLSTTAVSGRLSIVVADHGIGIAEDDLSRVFEPFFRADKSRTRGTGGLGLGLALSKQIVDAHEGSLSVASQVHRGTVATVSLPLP